MTENCKEVLLTIVVTAILIAVFSYLNLPAKEIKKPSAMKFKGDSGSVIPGDGKATEDPVTQEKTETVTEETEEVTEVTEAISEGKSEEIHTVIKEKHNKMDGMLISFWHGVAAVLIGEASALMVAYIWMKIRGNK
jgi:hypothetical protein